MCKIPGKVFYFQAANVLNQRIDCCKSVDLVEQCPKSNLPRLRSKVLKILHRLGSGVLSSTWRSIAYRHGGGSSGRGYTHGNRMFPVHNGFGYGSQIYLRSRCYSKIQQISRAGGQTHTWSIVRLKPSLYRNSVRYEGLRRRRLSLDLLDMYVSSASRICKNPEMPLYNLPNCFKRAISVAVTRAKPLDVHSEKIRGVEGVTRLLTLFDSLKPSFLLRVKYGRAQLDYPCGASRL